MSNNNSLAHTKWNCKYHIVFAPKSKMMADCLNTVCHFADTIHNTCIQKKSYLIYLYLLTGFIPPASIKLSLGGVMQIRDVGFNGVHGKNFVFRSESIKREGFDEHLLLFLRTNAVCLIDGSKIFCPVNSIIMFSPESDYQYQASGESFINDWMFLYLTEEDITFLESLQIKQNESIEVANMEELSGLVHALAYEHFSVDAYQDEIEQAYLRLLFYKTAQGIWKAQEQHGTAINPKSFKCSNAALTMLHADILRNPGKKRTIDELAGTIGISRSGLQHQYKKMFGISIKGDIIRARMERAKKLLAETNITIREIAFACGYSNEYHFIRQFKKGTGKTPTEYRRYLVKEQ